MKDGIERAIGSPAMRQAPEPPGKGWAGKRVAFVAGVRDCCDGYSYPWRVWANEAMQHEYELAFYEQLWQHSDRAGAWRF